MKRYGYSGGFSSATLAAGGTLGILIPPSVILVIYAILAEQNIAKLFLAAFIPGILAAIGYMITVSIYVRLNPDAAGVRPPVPMAERFRSMIDVLPVLVVFLVVVGGIYAGLFTPTEGAAVGAAGTGLIAWVNGGLRGRAWLDSFFATAKSTAMIFFIVLGAAFYNGFLALTQVPQELATWVVEQGYNPWLVLVMILALYLVFGCLMDSLSMILLTIPIFFPIVSALDFGLSSEEFAIWFGIIVLIVVEVGLITPPVGMNLFVINSMDRETPIVKTYGAVMYFVGSDLVRVAILVLFPGITLFLLRIFS
jgi:tripartite ATP-independent transporter DctM subunit